MKKRGIYTIARIGVFKDNPLAHAKPDLAVKTTGGAVWLDNENLAWVDPAKKEVRDCNIAVAEETALPGFDEIQFDCARFQDAAGRAYSVQNNEENTANVCFSPWLNAFWDYALDRRYFRRQQVQAQISAAGQFGCAGWMLWNPQNIYSLNDLKKCNCR
ncbi:MAG: putative glycoside hydrolase [Nitrospirota bacterium]|nr:putative glycoside hydrolase [Nitrospirota bacterium]